MLYLTKLASLSLEHNLFKNVYTTAAFLWQTQIQTIIYGLNNFDKKKIILILYLFTTSEINLQTILMPKVILANICHKKAGLLEPFLFQVCFRYLAAHRKNDVQPYYTLPECNP